MYKFEIEGQHPLSGEVSLLGGKNNVIPIICATLLTDQPCIIKNIPKISDVRVLIKILRILGSDIKYITPSELKIVNKNLSIDKDKEKLIFENIQKMRGSILLIAPLLYRFKNISFIHPGGDKIGGRDLSAHFSGFKKLGVNIEFTNTNFSLSGNLKPNYIFLYEPSVTATENLLMLSAIIKGESIIENAACEPHVKDLCIMLTKMGVQIEGIGTNILKIKGDQNLSGVDFTVSSDEIEAATYIIFALMSKGEIKIQNIDTFVMKSIFYVFDMFNIKYTIGDNYIYIKNKQDLYYKGSLGFGNLGIYTHPYPGFPTDLLSLVISLATQVKGEVIFFEKMYENRIDFALELKKMGATFNILDTHRILVKGPVKLHSANIFSRDIRSGVAYLSAMLSASGISTLTGIENIDRGYPNIEKTLDSLNAKVKRIKI